jgi:hypothetical protein
LDLTQKGVKEAKKAVYGGDLLQYCWFGCKTLLFKRQLGSSKEQFL